MSEFFDYLISEPVKGLVTVALITRALLMLIAFIRMMIYNLREGIKAVWFKMRILLCVPAVFVFGLMSHICFSNAEYYVKWISDVDAYGKAGFAAAHAQEYENSEGVIVVDAEKFVGGKQSLARKSELSAFSDGVILLLMAIAFGLEGAMSLQVITSCGFRGNSMRKPVPVHIKYDREKLLLIVYGEPLKMGDGVVKILHPSAKSIERLKYFIDEEEAPADPVDIAQEQQDPR